MCKYKILYFAIQISFTGITNAWKIIWSGRNEGKWVYEWYTTFCEGCVSLTICIAVTVNFHKYWKHGVCVQWCVKWPMKEYSGDTSGSVNINWKHSHYFSQRFEHLVPTQKNKNDFCWRPKHCGWSRCHFSDWCKTKSVLRGQRFTSAEEFTKKWWNH